MNLFSVFSEIDPCIFKENPEETFFREDMGEWQFYYRGEEMTPNEVYKSLEKSGYAGITFVERLK